MAHNTGSHRPPPGLPLLALLKWMVVDIVAPGVVVVTVAVSSLI